MPIFSAISSSFEGISDYIGISFFSALFKSTARYVRSPMMRPPSLYLTPIIAYQGQSKQSKSNTEGRIPNEYRQLWRWGQLHRHAGGDV